MSENNKILIELFGINQVIIMNELKNLNNWQLKMLLVKNEIALHLNSEPLIEGNNVDKTYDTIDYILDKLNMSIYESAVLNDHISLLKAFLGLNDKNQVFESAYQFYYTDNRINS